jgi:hypothetical protein
MNQDIVGVKAPSNKPLMGIKPTFKPADGIKSPIIKTLEGRHNPLIKPLKGECPIIKPLEGIMPHNQTTRRENAP